MRKEQLGLGEVVTECIACAMTEIYEIFDDSNADENGNFIPTNENLLRDVVRLSSEVRQMGFDVATDKVLQDPYFREFIQDQVKELFSFIDVNDDGTL